MKAIRYVVSLLILLGLLAVPQALSAQDGTPPLDPERLTVVDVQTFELLAGTRATAAFLAPSGEVFAYLDRRSICLYSKAGVRQKCLDLPREAVTIDKDSFHWSPDSTRLTFALDFVRFLTNADLFLVDFTNDRLSNLTDDGVRRIPGFSSSDTPKVKTNIEFNPKWLAADRIAFLNYPFGNRAENEIGSSELVILNLSDNSRNVVSTLAEPSAIPNYIWAVSADERYIAYNFLLPGSNANNGLWLLDTKSGLKRQLFRAQFDYQVPTEIVFSPDGKWLLWGDGRLFFDPSLISPENSAWRVISVEGGAPMLIDPERLVIGAGWLPNSSALLYLVRDVRNDENSGLYITSAAGQPGRQLLAGKFVLPTPSQRQALFVSAQNSLLVTVGGSPDTRLITLGVK
jgi:hypothetical protein